MHVAKTVMIGSLLATALTVSPVQAQRGPPPTGYLPPDALDLTRIVPPPPAMNSPHQKADQALFKDTRKMVGTPRYALATADTGMTPDTLLDGFSCAAGLQLSPQSAPKLTALGNRITGDAMAPMVGAKEAFKRVRPFVLDKGEVCEKHSMSGSYDYPSGHAAVGWTWAMLLSSLIPDRATEVMARGRAYGESRIICGVHSTAAVDAGQMSATAVMARLQASAEYRADLEAARAEMAVLRGAAPPKNPAACAVEAQALSVPVPR